MSGLRKTARATRRGPLWLTRRSTNRPVLLAMPPLASAISLVLLNAAFGFNVVVSLRPAWGEAPRLFYRLILLATR
jgi:hypothetical protein